MSNWFQSSSKQQKFDAFFLENDISLRSDYAKLQQLINALKTRIVFCHNDLLIQNILYDSSTGSFAPLVIKKSLVKLICSLLR